jgi:hypothetical protein
MANRRKNDRSARFRILWLLIPFLALATFGLTEFLAVRPHLVEKYYSSGLYPLIAKILSPISGLAPFSFSDLFYAMLILTVPVVILLATIRRITYGKMWRTLLNLFAGVYLLFYWLWGFNYYRQSSGERLGIEKSKANPEEFMAVFLSLIEQANNYKVSEDAIGGMQQLDSLTEAAYAQHAGFLQIKYPMGLRRPKHITLAGFFAKAGISGYYGPFFNEVHVNPHAHPLELPVITAHEKAHQLGITSEAEASFYAWFVCSHSHSELLRYSAALYIIRYFLNHGYGLDGFNETVAQISEPVRNDLRAIRDNWLALRNEKIDRAASKANDAYLKTHKITAGIADYRGVVALVMDFRTDTLSQKSVDQF